MSQSHAEPGDPRSTSAVPADRSRLRRILTRLPTIVLLTTMWVILWGKPEPGTIVAGAIVATLCYWAAKLPHIPVRLSFRPLAALRLVAYIGYDLVASSVRVAIHSLWRPNRTSGAIVAEPLRTDSDFLLAMITGGLSLVTGSLVIELNREEGVVYMHGIPMNSPRSVEQLRRQIRRTEELFVRAFGTNHDLAEFQRRANGGSTN
ncbi:Na+/H+ antiporter subunit E [Salinactinospora qingdaonensis]|uniref:Na+/H+ antiporter subunit E n=1 Tax=Salinactinospora qingdaonensis TaxID=702744 RepID=A0ABP7ESZ3_9ACTN